MTDTQTSAPRNAKKDGPTKALDFAAALLSSIILILVALDFASYNNLEIFGRSLPNDVSLMPLALLNLSIVLGVRLAQKPGGPSFYLSVGLWLCTAIGITVMEAVRILRL
jgi:hypothetical protein